MIIEARSETSHLTISDYFIIPSSYYLPMGLQRLAHTFYSLLHLVGCSGVPQSAGRRYFEGMGIRRNIFFPRLVGNHMQYSGVLLSRTSWDQGLKLSSLFLFSPRRRFVLQTEMSGKCITLFHFCLNFNFSIFSP